MTSLTDRKVALSHWLRQEGLIDEGHLQVISGDAGFRKYYRFTLNGTSRLAVDANPDTEKNWQFVDLADQYAAVDVEVPKIFHYDLQQGFLCIEDLGDTLLSEVLKLENLDQFYWLALGEIPKIQQVIGYQSQPLPDYAESLLDMEFEIFTQWLVEHHLQLTLTPSQCAMLKQAFSILSDNFVEQPVVGVHRDFHSRNLLLREDNRIGVIDFQDTVTGPLTYDVVSLLRDCYLRWPDEDIQRLLVRYHLTYCADYPWETFKRWFDLTGVQRHIKVCGIFARLHHRDGKPAYLKDIPRVLEYIVDVAGQYAELNEFVEFIDHVVEPSLKRIVE